MNLLLVNPFISDFTAYDLWVRPLGLLELAALLRKTTRCDLFWLDCLNRFAEETPHPPGRSDGRGPFVKTPLPRPPTYEGIPRRYNLYGRDVEAVSAELARLPQPDLILITSLMTYWVDGLRFTQDLLRRRFPRTPQVLGGILPTLVSPRDLLRHGIHAELLVKGENPEPLYQLLSQMGVPRTAPLPPWTRQGLPDPQDLSPPRILPLRTTRGCPGRCTYCASRLIHPQFQRRQPHHLLTAIQSHLQQAPLQEIVFFDDALLEDSGHHLVPFLEGLAPQGPFRLHTPNGLSPRLITPRVASLMRRTGFSTLRLSFEGIDADLCAQSTHKVRMEDWRRGVAHLQEAGFAPDHLGCYLLHGLPGQTPEGVARALDEVEALGLSPHLCDLSPVPGTGVFRQLQQAGFLEHPLNLYQTSKVYGRYHLLPWSPAEDSPLRQRAQELCRRHHPGA